MSATGKASTINGTLINLVPYTSEHVPLYHEWLTNPELLKLTGSESVELSEEYENQKEWANNENKCTFLIYDKQLNKLVGDVNINIVDTELPESDNNTKLTDNLKRTGELMVMIAESDARKKGLAAEALQLMMNFANNYFNIHRFNTKISASNIPSLNLFKNKLKFTELQYIDAFQEYELIAPNCTCNTCKMDNLNITNHSNNNSTDNNNSNSNNRDTAALRFLKSQSIPFTIHEYAYIEKGGTAASSAALGIDEHKIIKTLIFLDRTNNIPFVVLMHGDCNVDLKLLAKEISAKKGTLVICHVDVAQEYSGYQVGGTSPFGLKKPMKIYLEKSITEIRDDEKQHVGDNNKNDHIIINGGGRGLLIRISVSDLIRVLNPTLITCKSAPKESKSK